MLVLNIGQEAYSIEEERLKDGILVGSSQGCDIVIPNRAEKLFRLFKASNHYMVEPLDTNTVWIDEYPNDFKSVRVDFDEFKISDLKFKLGKS